MMDPLPLDVLRELLEDYVERDPCWGGFTRERTEEILRSAVHYAELAEKYEKIRESNRAATRKWRKSKKGGRSGSLPRRSNEGKKAVAKRTEEGHEGAPP